jgi:hypothetical protein
MVHILIYLSFICLPPVAGRPLFSRDDCVQMVQMVQESGAANLWSLQLVIYVMHRPEICEAIRVGWLDVPCQPTLRGEWQFHIRGVYSDGFDIPTPAPDVSMDCQIG